MNVIMDADYNNLGACTVANDSASRVLLQRLTTTNGFAVRQNADQDAYWYTSGKPGPFYINTENIAGEHEAETVLISINEILTTGTREQQAKAIIRLIDWTIQADEAYQASIDVLADYYLSQNTGYKPTIISGGERRDWFFSIPLARKLNLPHLFLFKNGDTFLTDHEGTPVTMNLKDQKSLHVADIINLASSYVDRWIPILKTAHVQFSETLTVSVRSQDGAEALNRQGVAIVSPLVVNLSLFQEALRLGLINEFGYNEIELYYESPREWTRRFLSQQQSTHTHPRSNVTKAKQDRIESFTNNDPYELKNEFPHIFA